MARRGNKEDNLLEGILDLFLDIGKTLPWWVTLPAAILLFVFVPFEVPTDVQMNQSTDFVGIIIGTFFKALFKYVIPAALFFGAIISIVKRTNNKLGGSEGVCPRCGAALAQRRGRKGKFIGCSSFPRCRYTKDV